MLAKINEAILVARKARDKFKVKVLSTLKAELINNSKAKKPLQDMRAVSGYAKKLEKAAQAFAKTDRYEDLLNEIMVIKEFLPKPMAPERIKEKVKELFVDSIGPYNKGEMIKTLKDSLGPENGKYIVQYVNEMLV